MLNQTTQVALGSCEGELAALKQQNGEDRHSLELAHKKLKMANAAVKKYEEEEEEPGTAVFWLGYQIPCF